MEANPLSKRVLALKPSPTMAVSQRAKALKRQGVDVIDFGVGEPDFNTPDFIREAAKQALDKGATKYTEAAGIPKLREAIAKKASQDMNLSFSAKEVIVGLGAKQILFNLCLALLDPEDEAIVVSPYWVTYPAQVEFAGGTPVVLETTFADGFCIDPDRLASVISPKTKLIFLNSPSNPTGAVLDKDRLRAIAEVLRQHPRIHIISDEIYCSVYYHEGRAPSILQVAPDLRSRTIIVDGASKSYAMTGWRLGWALGPEQIIASIASLQSQSTSNAVSFAQFGLLSALESSQDCIKDMLKIFSERKELIISSLRSIPKVQVLSPGGAFYVFPDVSAYLTSPLLDGEKTMGLANYLLEKSNIAVVPGSAFGAEGFLRLSYALSKEQLIEGVSRLKDCLMNLLK